MTIFREKRRTGLRFGIVYFLLFSVYGISSPYLQIMLRKLGYSPAYVGVLLGMFELIGIAGPIVLARRADALGRFNPFLAGAGLAVAVGNVFLVAFQGPLAAILGLGLISLGLKTPVPVLDSSALIALEAERSAKTKAPSYGFLRALGSVGFVIVTLAAQLFPGFDDKPPAFMAAAMAGLALVFFASVFLLPESGKGKKNETKAAYNLSWIDSSFAIGLAVIALSRLAMAPIGSFFSLFLVETLNWHAVGAMSALGAAVEIPMMIIAWRLLRRWSPMAIINVSSAAIFVRLLIYALFPTRAGAVAGQLLHSLCYGTFLPAAVTFINLKTPPEARTLGNAMLLGLGMGLPAFVGSALGGLVAEAFGYRWLFALFSLFAVGAMLLYRRNAAELRATR